MFSPTQLNTIFKNLLISFPDPQTELFYLNEFTLLVAIVLSAQATDRSVNKATSALFREASTPQEFIALGEERLKQYIKNIGLYNTKAQNIIKLSNLIVREYNSIVPSNFENLLKLPGVGRKTANVFLNVIFKLPTMPVDTHVQRVSNRIGLVTTNNVEQTEIKLLKIIPREWIYQAHHLFVLHGRYICKARNPECGKCNINEHCQYYKKMK